MPSRIAGDCLSVVRGRGDVSPRVAAVEACRELRLSESAGVIVSTSSPPGLLQRSTSVERVHWEVQIDWLERSNLPRA